MDVILLVFRWKNSVFFWANSVKMIWIEILSEFTEHPRLSEFVCRYEHSGRSSHPEWRPQTVFQLKSVENREMFSGVEDSSDVQEQLRRFLFTRESHSSAMGKWTAPYNEQQMPEKVEHSTRWTQPARGLHVESVEIADKERAEVRKKTNLHRQSREDVEAAAIEFGGLKVRVRNEHLWTDLEVSVYSLHIWKILLADGRVCDRQKYFFEKKLEHRINPKMSFIKTDFSEWIIGLIKNVFL